MWREHLASGGPVREGNGEGAFNGLNRGRGQWAAES